MTKVTQDDPPRGFAAGALVDDRYRVVRFLGEGGNSLVHEVEHVRTGRRLALKTLLDPAAVARLEQEARATSLLKGDHAVKITDMGTAPIGGPYLVMELLEGQSLRALLDDAGQLPLELTVNLALQVCECLAEAHSHGIVHRDLKPENIFLCASRWPGQYEVRVLDFGVVKIATEGPIPKGSLTRTGSTVGTPYYMSLEQLRNSSNVDARADLYSLAVLLYESLCGRKPFQADTIGDLVYALCSGPPTHLGRLRPDLPHDVAELLMRSLHMDREDRPASMLELARALLPHGNAAFGLWLTAANERPAAWPAPVEAPLPGVVAPAGSPATAPPSASEARGLPAPARPPQRPPTPRPAVRPSASLPPRPDEASAGSGEGTVTTLKPSAAPPRPAPLPEPPAPALDAMGPLAAPDPRPVTPPSNVQGPPPRAPQALAATDRPAGPATPVEAPPVTPNTRILEGAGPPPAPASNPRGFESFLAEASQDDDADPDSSPRGRRDTPTEMYVKSAHGLRPAPPGPSGDRDTPTKAFLLPDDRATDDLPAPPRHPLRKTLPLPVSPATPQPGGDDPEEHGTLPMQSASAFYAGAGGPPPPPPPSQGELQSGVLSSPFGHRPSLVTEGIPPGHRPQGLTEQQQMMYAPTLQAPPTAPQGARAPSPLAQFVEGAVSGFRTAPRQTQILLGLALGVPLLLFASSILYLLTR